MSMYTHTYIYIYTQYSLIPMVIHIDQPCISRLNPRFFAPRRCDAPRRPAARERAVGHCRTGLSCGPEICEEKGTIYQEEREVN